MKIQLLDRNDNILSEDDYEIGHVNFLQVGFACNPTSLVIVSDGEELHREVLDHVIIFRGDGFSFSANQELTQQLKEYTASKEKGNKAYLLHKKNDKTT